MKKNTSTQLAPKYFSPDIFVVFGLIVSTLVIGYLLWSQIKFFPYIADTANLIVTGTKILQQKANSITLNEISSAHPTLFMLILRQIWQLWGESTQVTHATMIPIYSLLAVSFYLTARKYLQAVPALLATFLMLFMPVTIREFQMVSLELTGTAFLFLSIWMWHQKQTAVSMLIFMLSALIRPSMILFLPFFLISFFWKRERSLATAEYRIFFIPILGLLLWYFYHSSESGWWFLAPNRLLLGLSSIFPIIQLTLINIWNFLSSQMRILWMLPSFVISIFLLTKHRSQIDYSEKVLLLSGLVILVLYNVYLASFSARTIAYQLPALYIWTLISVIFIEKLVNGIIPSEKGWLIPAMLLGLIFLQPFIWHPRIVSANQDFRVKANLEFQDEIFVHRQAAAFIESTYPEAKVYGGFPEGYLMTQPFQGYVSSPLDFALCNDFQLQSNKTTIVINHPADMSQIPCRRITESLQMRELETFTSGSYWVQLFSLSSDATSSGEIIPGSL